VIGPTRRFQILFHGLFVEVFRFSFDDSESILGAFSQTGSQAVTELFRYQPGLPVHDLQRPLGAGRHTQAAAVAFFFVDLDDLSFDLHVFLLLIFCVPEAGTKEIIPSPSPKL